MRAFLGLVLTSILATAAPDHDVARRDALAHDMAHGRVLSGATPQRILHFTFDDGPRLDTTPRLLDHLDDAGVRATFFLVARQLDAQGVHGRHHKQVALVRDMMRRGHTVGLHGWDHTAIDVLGPEALDAQLDRSEQVFEAQLGARPWLFRPPYGKHDDATVATLAARGYTPVLWNVVAEGPGRDTPGEIAAAFAASLDRREQAGRRGGGGGIVLLHDTHPWVVDAFPQMMADLRARNCALAARGEELWDVVDDPRVFYVARGDTEPQARAGRVRMSAAEHARRQAALRASLAGCAR